MTDPELLNLLKNDLQLLQKAADILARSYQNCIEIGLKQDYSFDELTEYEAFSSRFARLIDILIQKIFRLIDEMNLAPEGTVRDSINRAEKNLIIDSAETLIEMKRLRNQVAHEYIIEKLTHIFERIIALSPVLLDCVKRTEKYCKTKFPI